MKNFKKRIMLSACTVLTSSLSAQETDWAGFSRYAELNKTVTSPPKVVFMGNSITEGWWYSDSLFFKENEFLARGISGQTTSQMLVRFRKDVIELANTHHIDVVLCSVLPAYDFSWHTGLEPAGKIVELNKMLETYATGTESST